MPAVFVISDHHFDHSGILHFTHKEDGTRIRPMFDNVDQMNDYMVTMWNSVVRPNDKIYHLGDVSMTDKGLKYVAMCNGHKRLILGNHDKLKSSMYLKVFEQLYGSRQLDGMIMTHYPIHDSSIGPRVLANVHGHVHNNVPALHFGPNHFNVSVEMLDYTPISLEDLKLSIAKQKEEYEQTKESI